MKRSSRISLVLLSSMSAMAVSGCEEAPPAKVDNGGTFANKAECVAAYDQDTCDAAEKLAKQEHLANAPKSTREQCIAEYGADMCRPASEYGGSSNMFMPMMIGYMLGSATSSPAPLYYGPGSYRNRNDRGYQAPIYSSGRGYNSQGPIGRAPYIPAVSKTTPGSLKSTTALTPPASQRAVFGSTFKPTTSFKSSYAASNPSSFGRTTYSAPRATSYSSASSSRGVFGSSGRSFGGSGG